MIEGSYILTNKNQLRTAMRNLAEQPTDATSAHPLSVDTFIAPYDQAHPDIMPPLSPIAPLFSCSPT